jgi:hypothetical protein
MRVQDQAACTDGCYAAAASRLGMIANFRVRNSVIASTAIHTMNAVVFMRSHTPAHGVGRLACSREA